MKKIIFTAAISLVLLYSFILSATTSFNKESNYRDLIGHARNEITNRDLIGHARNEITNRDLIGHARNEATNRDLIGHA